MCLVFIEIKHKIDLKVGWKLFPKIKAILLGNIQVLSLGVVRREKTHVAIVGVHTASATAEKQKW